MKASVKLRPEEGKPPLLRAKLPISVLGLPLISSASVTAASAAGGNHPKDLSLHLRTALSTGPSIKLSYLPNLSPHPFSLSLTSGISSFGSPHGSPLLFSAHLSLSPSSPLSFSICFAHQFGDFTLRKTAVSSPSPNPKPNPNKENGDKVYLPFSAPDEILAPGVEVSVRTTLPVHHRAAVRLRWAVNFAPVGSGGLPYLTVNKIGVEPVEVEDCEEGKDPVEAKRPEKQWGEEGNLEAMKEMCFWMKKEVEELQRENWMIKESIEAVKSNV